MEQWVRSVPPVTRALLAATGVTTLAVSVGLVRVEHVMMFWPLVLRRLHLWRLVTDFFYAGSFSFGWLFHMWLFSSYAAQLEKHRSFSSAVTGSRGAFLYFVVLQMFALQVLSLLIFFPNGKPLLNGSLVFAVIYYWSRKEPFVTVSLWGLPLLGWQLPYALLVLDVLMGASLWQDVMGLATAHLYHYARDILPSESGKRPLETVPVVFDSLAGWLENPSFTGPATAAAAAHHQPPTAPRYQYGSGRANFATLHGPSRDGGTAGRGGDEPDRHEFPGQGRRLNE